MSVVPFRTGQSLVQRLGALQQEMNDLFSSFAGELPRWMPRAGEVLPAIDVKETDDEVTLTCELPGVRREDIDVQIEGNLLTLRGEKQEEKKEVEGEREIRREVRYGSFMRQITLPSEVDSDKAEASMHEGVLKLRLPKTAPSKGKRIAISGD